MPDFCDRAQMATEQMLREARGRQAALAGQALSGHSLAHCLECGANIPEARRQAVPGCKLCVDCQEEIYG